MTYAKLQVIQKGGPFEIVQAEDPTIGDDEVLIQHKVIALNRIDFIQRDMGVEIASWPHVLGVEGAGIVEAVGAKVSNLQPGDEVVAWETGTLFKLPWGGAYQEKVVMPAKFVAKKPSNISLEEAASLPICYNMGVVGLNTILGIPLPFIPGTDTTGTVPSSILILGGGSASGGAAIQLLHLAHPSVKILTTAAPRHADRLTSYGATKVFDYKSPTLVADIKAEGGADVILDCIAAGLQQRDISDVLTADGPKKYAAQVTGPPLPVPEGVNLTMFGGFSLIGSQGEENVIPALTTLVEQAKYKPPVPTKVIGKKLGDIPDVMDQLKTDTGVKLLVTL